MKSVKILLIIIMIVTTSIFLLKNCENKPTHTESIIMSDVKIKKIKVDSLAHSIKSNDHKVSLIRKVRNKIEVELLSAKSLKDSSMIIKTQDTLIHALNVELEAVYIGSSLRDTTIKTQEKIIEDYEDLNEINLKALKREKKIKQIAIVISVIFTSLYLIK
jgi:hypothetical protein